MYSQYIPHFPTLWLTKDERSLLYKYFILNPSLCCISSIVSSHLQILHIVQKSADVGKGHALVGSPAAPGAAAQLPGRMWGVLPPFGNELCWPRKQVTSEGWMWPHCLPALGGQIQGGWPEWEQDACLWLCKQKCLCILLPALDLGENGRVKTPLCQVNVLQTLLSPCLGVKLCQQARLDNLT